MLTEPWISENLPAELESIFVLFAFIAALEVRCRGVREWRVGKVGNQGHGRETI